MLASPSRSRRIRRADSASSTVARRMPTNANAPALAPDASSAHAPANLTANPAAHAGSRTPRPRPPEARIRGPRRSPRRAVQRPRDRTALRHALTVCLAHRPKCLPLPAAAVSLRPVITGWRPRADAAARGSAGSARREEPQQCAAAVRRSRRNPTEQGWTFRRAARATLSVRDKPCPRGRVVRTFRSSDGTEVQPMSGAGSVFEVVPRSVRAYGACKSGRAELATGGNQV